MNPTEFSHGTTAGCAGYQVGSGAILYQQQSLLSQLEEQLRLPDELKTVFDRSLNRLVMWYHLLPAHPGHHCEPAGAVRHALETALWSVTATQGIHTDNTLYADQRRAREPLWRLAAGVAGLLYDSGRMVTCLQVQSGTSGGWPSFQQALGVWLEQQRISHYTPSWHRSDNQPESNLSPEYTAVNLLLLPKLTCENLATVLQPGCDRGVLWQSFIGALTCQNCGHGISSLANAVALARLKSIRLQYLRGEALPQMITPAPRPADEAKTWLKEVVLARDPTQLKWAGDSLLLIWPDAVAQCKELPDASTVLGCWSKKDWIKPVANQVVFRRNGRQVIALQPAISKQCRQWVENRAAGDHDA